MTVIAGSKVRLKYPVWATEDWFLPELLVIFAVVPAVPLHCLNIKYVQIWLCPGGGGHRSRVQNDPISVIRKPAEVLFVFLQPTNIPCLEQSDAITVNCYQNNTTKTVGVNPVWLIIGCWIILLDLFLVLLSAHSILADVPAPLSAHRSF